MFSAVEGAIYFWPNILVLANTNNYTGNIVPILVPQEFDQLAGPDVLLLVGLLGVSLMIRLAFHVFLCSVSLFALINRDWGGWFGIIALHAMYNGMSGLTDFALKGSAADTVRGIVTYFTVQTLVAGVMCGVAGVMYWRCTRPERSLVFRV
jgi:hypothetical protein